MTQAYFCFEFFRWEKSRNVEQIDIMTYVLSNITLCKSIENLLNMDNQNKILYKFNNPCLKYIT